jgi:hypothetical protein
VVLEGRCNHDSYPEVTGFFPNYFMLRIGFPNLIS